MLTDEEKVVDIQLEVPKKSKFRINGDSTKILELNISDLGIIERLEIGYANLQLELQKIGRISDEDEDMTKKLKEIDKSMRKQIDYIFDSNVSEVCVGKSGTMYDPFKGQLRFEHIIDTLLNLYEKNIGSEFRKIKTRIQKHTDKYIPASIPASKPTAITSRRKRK